MSENNDDVCWQSDYIAPMHTIIERRIEGATLFTVVELEGSVSEFSRPATEDDIAFYALISARRDNE